jgi:hypothetical protein
MELGEGEQIANVWRGGGNGGRSRLYSIVPGWGEYR